MQENVLKNDVIKHVLAKFMPKMAESRHVTSQVAIA